MRRLGDILVEQGAISRAQLEQFLPQLQGRIGEALRAHTLIRSRALAQAIAEQQQLPYIALANAPMTPGLFVPRQLGHYVRHRYLPYRHSEGTLLCVTPDPSPALAEQLAAHYAMPVTLGVISTRDFTAALGTQAATTLARRASLHLRRHTPLLVADRVLHRAQRQALTAIAALFALAIALAPHTSWMLTLLLANLFYLTTLLFRFLLYLYGRSAQRLLAPLAVQLDAAAALLPPQQWPVYTILVPLYRETFPVLTRVISHLHALDYPRERLDIKLICEADDAATHAALKQCKPPETMEIITVTPSYPRTKPKACNVALSQMRGDYLVIYDAEDAPDPLQLKRAVMLFRQSPPQVACVQAALNYYNHDENLLTRLFSIEYGALFSLTLPALQRLALPIPLSGTSNHLRVDALQKVGGWDAFNVTEDADLGMRLAYFGYRTHVLPTRTLEESPITLGAWMRQRSRWVKGFMQTWLVYMRAPGDTRRHLGWRGWIGLQLCIGAPALTFLIAPFFWLAWGMNLASLWRAYLPAWLWTICAVSFLSGMALQWLYATKVVRLERWRGMRLAIALYPCYWLLHSVASLWALWQLVRAPHHWEKTTHGVSRIFR